jgi:hypothetical protein
MASTGYAGPWSTWACTSAKTELSAFNRAVKWAEANLNDLERLVGL